MPDEEVLLIAARGRHLFDQLWHSACNYGVWRGGVFISSVTMVALMTISAGASAALVRRSLAKAERSSAFSLCKN